MTAVEQWRAVPGYEGLYEVSNLGRVRSLDRMAPYRHTDMLSKINGKVLAPIVDSHGYVKVNLCANGKRHSKFVHRLVAEAFIHNPAGLPIINHIDENPQNNTVENLEWCTYKYNTNYGSCIAKISKSATGIKKNISAETREKMRSRTAVPVVGINRDTFEEVFYASMRMAENDGFREGCISLCIKHPGQTHKGYYWRQSYECS